MHKYKYITITHFLIVFYAAFAQNYNIPSISEKKLAEHVFFLASDSLKGRGIEGNLYGLDIAADYLMKKAAVAGLKPVNNEYWQHFSLYSSKTDKKNSYIKVNSDKGSYLIDAGKYTINNRRQKNYNIKGDVLFLGFGIPDDENNSELLSKINKKIVLIAAGTPESFKTTASIIWNENQENKKISKILSYGAAAVILITSTDDTKNETFSRISDFNEGTYYSLKETGNFDESKIIIATPELADIILNKKGSWKKKLHKFVKDKTETGILSGITIEINSEKEEEVKNVKNIADYIEGEDSQLKDEYIVFMAHYDHLGTDKNGEIYNGADDNASGAATLLEVAAAFANSETKPARNLLFLWVTAEEAGLIGSEYYINNPLFPIEKTVACINLDMVGRVYEPRDSVWAGSPKLVKPFNEIYVLLNNINPELKSVAEDACKSLNILPDFTLPEKFLNYSDHYHFHKNNIPVLNFSTGYSADYHKPTDIPEKINFSKMKNVAALCYITGQILANQ